MVGGFSMTQQRALTRLALDQQLKLQYDSVIAALDYEGRAGLAVSSVIANLPPVADIGVALGKEFADRAKKRFGVDLAVHWLDGKEFKTLSSTFSGDVATQDELKSVFDGATLRRDATLAGHPAALYLGQIKNYVGQPVAVIELIKDTTEYEAAASSAQRDLILGTVAVLVVA